MQIKMVDLAGQYTAIKLEIDSAIQKVLDSTAFIQGPETVEFASALSKYIGGSHVVPCANGTDALQIAMMALDLEPGDEIILPVHTYVATAEVIALLRLKPVFVDVDASTFNINVKDIERNITPRTKVIVPVHLYGQCADMEAILSVASKYNLFVIEDAAQALGSVYTFSDGTQRQAGTMGTIGTTSFFPSKNLGCFGDGGAVFTNDSVLAAKIKMIANHGQAVKYKHEIIGVNSRLDTLQAAILTVKLNHLDSYTRKRNQVADFYDEHLKKNKRITLPFRSPSSTHVFHQYTLTVGNGGRNEFQKLLADNGIPTMIYYPIPLYEQVAYRKFRRPSENFPVAELLSQSVISLPIHTEMTEHELDYISGVIRNF